MVDATLTPTTRLTVRFHGERSGSAELTWAQRHIWERCRAIAPQEAYFNLHRVIEPPGTCDAAQVARAVRLLVERYEALRTTIGRAPDGQPRQQVAATGELDIDVHEVDVAGDVTSTVELASVEHGGHRFTDDEWPLRVAVVTRSGKVLRVLLTASHVAVDWVGVRLVCGVFAQLLAGDSADLPPATHHPLDEAIAETSPAGRQRAERAAEYWRQTLRTVPHTLATTTGVAEPTERQPRQWSPAGQLRSSAVAMAANLLAERHDATPTSVVLAAFSALLCARSGIDLTSLQLFVGNRFAPQHRDMVTTRVQHGLFAVDLREATFVTAVRRTKGAALCAYRHAQYPPALIQEAIDDVSVQRGLRIDLSFFFHDRTHGVWPGNHTRALEPEPATIADALSRSRYRRDVLWDRHQQLRFDLQARDPWVMLRLAADPRFLSAQEVATVLHGIETLLVTAVRGDFPLADVPALTGLASVCHSREVRSDGCWIAPEVVRLLVSDVPDVTATHIDITGPPTDHRLVAHVATRNPSLSAADLHVACMYRVRSRPGSSTPHHYVIHPHTPHLDPAQRWWESIPIQSQGTGRPPLEPGK
ncbi:hypothetical protein GCM10022225_07880 [Plantactinospora mayteni]|uniref:Condensation domain-containing protein n=1 Tax=Plantactinospora mayteni TaxID=566021 RepID=A0ABQ4EI99_9ACTN|nr:condensation domain-containing protein [Plantactinospora mayteni]GIG94466.1 hypothetical protein Pma05_10390 [Plantactinospora mayteni]